MITPPILQPTTFFDQEMVNEITILAAIADLKTQTKLNYDATVKKHNFGHNTLQKHFKNEIISVVKLHSENLKFFSNIEKQMFMNQFNILSIQNISLTFKMLANIVQKFTDGKYIEIIKLIISSNIIKPNSAAFILII